MFKSLSQGAEGCLLKGFSLFQLPHHPGVPGRRGADLSRNA